MSRVLTFSTEFPAYHPKAGQPTWFVEKIMAFCAENIPDWKMPKDLKAYDWHQYYNCTNLKRHTIRAGHRWKVGDKFSPRIWSGKPYRSPQIIIGPDMEVKKVWDFEIQKSTKWAAYFVNGKMIITDEFAKLTLNDGLDPIDFEDWFQYKPMEGQIICWDENLEY